MTHATVVKEPDRNTIAVVVIAMWLGLTASRSFAATYNVLDLGVLNGNLSLTSGFGVINRLGQVVGESGNDGSGTHGFRTAPTSAINGSSDLGLLGGVESYAYGINDLGQAVGYAYTSDHAPRAFRTAPNGAISPASNLGTLGGPESYAYAINASGQVVGRANIGTVDHAFRTGPNASITPTDDLGTLGGATSWAYGVNGAGQAVGGSYIKGDFIMHAFRTAPNGVITPASDLGTLGGVDSVAYGVNASGQAVGSAGINGPSHAFRTTPNAPITADSDLGSLGGIITAAYAINTAGQVVGTSETSDLADHAFFVDVAGVMKDLNDLIPADSGWMLEEAHGINDSGQIAGFGMSNGARHAFLLTPVPEPATITAFALVGLGAIALRRRSRR